MRRGRWPDLSVVASATRRQRWIVFWIVAAGFFAMALSGDLYNLTSPPAFDLHVLLRKAYSIVAFTVVGASFVWASGATVAGSALAIAIYSGAIEIAQAHTGSHEGPYWNAFDVVCGGIGGWLGALIPWLRAR